MGSKSSDWSDALAMAFEAYGQSAEDAASAILYLGDTMGYSSVVVKFSTGVAPLNLEGITASLEAKLDAATERDASAPSLIGTPRRAIRFE